MGSQNYTVFNTFEYRRVLVLYTCMPLSDDAFLLMVLDWVQFQLWTVLRQWFKDAMLIMFSWTVWQWWQTCQKVDHWWFTPKEKWHWQAQPLPKFFLPTDCILTIDNKDYYALEWTASIDELHREFSKTTKIRNLNCHHATVSETEVWMTSQARNQQVVYRDKDEHDMKTVQQFFKMRVWV